MHGIGHETFQVLLKESAVRGVSVAVHIRQTLGIELEPPMRISGQLFLGRFLDHTILDRFKALQAYRVKPYRRHDTSSCGPSRLIGGKR